MIINHTPLTRSQRAASLFRDQWEGNARRTDRMFAVLMLLQWAAAVVVALTVSPRTWDGDRSFVHPHVWLAVCLGGGLAMLAVAWAWKRAGQSPTRYVIAVCQVGFSSLLVQITGGRIETHFHVFGSLAFLAFYRDWKVLIPATLVVALDHFVRNQWWPETTFGISMPGRWRWLEHAAWVLFEDIFLFISCRSGVRDMRAAAERRSELEDVNEEMRRQTENLRSSYEFQNAILETALDAVVTIDSSGSVTRWNSHAQAIFGWTEREVIGRGLAELVIPERFRSAHAEGLRSYLRTGDGTLLNRRFETTALDKQGREFCIELAITPIGLPPNVSFCAFARDITARHEAEKALWSAKEAAEESSRAKSAFLANMSHEIRTPLNGILGFADLLLHDAEELSLCRRDHLRTIHDCGRHLLMLINDVLDLSKIESGQLEVERTECSPHQIIAEVISILRVRAQERGLQLEYFWKSAIPETILTDPVRFRQILVNLVGNAIKFTEIGSVQVAARLMEGETPRLIIDVIDTGVGIAEEALDRIFDPFVQADTSVTRRFGGTGLGLSISRRLARALGGDVIVESAFGRGSVFSLEVQTGPLEGVNRLRGTSSDIVVASRPVVRARLHPCRILLVEDGLTNQKLIRLLLERAGATVQCAENGQAGVEAAIGEHWDLILMDMQMPVMDGYAASREIRRLGYSMPIVALTAHAMKGDEEKCRDAGCSDYLTKPIQAERLLETIAEALRAPCAGQQAMEAADKTEICSSLPAEDDEYQAIADEFIERFHEQLGALRAALERGDAEAAGKIAHWIKGSGGTAGFDVLTKPATTLERLLKQNEFDFAADQYRILEDLGRRLSSSAVHS